MNTSIYRALKGAEEGEATSRESADGVRHVVALTLTKTADGLIDPKLVLAWLLSGLGAPAAAIGALVPVREAGALLPQIALTRVLGWFPKRKWLWTVGAAAQAAAAVAIALIAVTMSGAAAGWAVIALLAVHSMARAACSISYKDALARTIPASRRGATIGAAGSLASIAVLGFAAALAVGLVPLSILSIAAAIAVAGAFWLLAAAILSGLDEPADRAGAAEDDGLADIVRPLFRDTQLRRFIAARALLTATALAPPFILLVSASRGAGAEGETSLGELGPYMLASAAASILSAYVWGRLSDRSSRLTLTAAAALAALALGGASAAGFVFGGLGGLAGAVAALFVAQLAYEGVRSGRKIHLTDMTSDDERARYVALSNSAIGVVLLLGGGLGVVADWLGPAAALAGLAALCAAAAPIAWGLDEAQSD